MTQRLGPFLVGNDGRSHLRAWHVIAAWRSEFKHLCPHSWQHASETPAWPCCRWCGMPRPHMYLIGRISFTL